MQIPALLARRLAILSLSLAPVLMIGTAAYAGNPAATCAATKRRAAARKLASKLKCVAKATGKGLPVDPECLTKAETKFDAAFAKAEALGGCLTTNDASSVESTVNGCVNSLRNLLGVSSNTPPASSCTATKLGATGKKTTGRMGCYNKALTTGAPVSSDCLTKVSTKFSDAFTKAQQKGDCLTSNDTTNVETSVDNCVTSIRNAIPGTLTCNSEPAAFSGVTAQHNSTRANASPTPNPPLSPLCWNNMVATHAQNWANNCNFSHDPALSSFGEGQNIYAECSSSGFPPNAAQNAEPLWASEAANYDYATNTCSGVCGHYTAIVWRSTSFLGCGIKNCTGNSPCGPSFPNWSLVVCNYQPRGNSGQRPY
jgi:hypothetical protein